jgi:Leucine-rich repeat (LRR) protein
MERLELRDSSLDDTGMEVIATLPKMSFLDISECRIVSSDGLKQIGKMTGLTLLSLWETKLDDAALNEFGGLVNLVDLDVKATKITDASIETLLKLKNLERLNVGGTQLSDESFRQLGKLPKLKYLNVANTSIGYDVMDEISAANEDLELVDF